MTSIQDYTPDLKESWLRCRALAYMHSSFTDEITDQREDIPASRGISLVAISDEQVVGLVDAIYLNATEVNPASYGFKAGTVLTVLDAVATHPDYQHQGIARDLINEVLRRLQPRGGELLIYTLDDVPANSLYRSLGAQLCYRASIVTAHSRHNRVPLWTDFKANANHEVDVYDAAGNPVDYAIDSETYYVGQKKYIAELDKVVKIATEHVYTLKLS
ncbi:GNAT family N-acetyltransferase [Levilactobacillus enshiensis]|uniref:GNAT family N-acetyltransferase n=1 Tax=Levilactobacillus enshiensis TaxID=2590213 RepID=UPI00117B5206|nr:GNAT family N-acetyltransferase [Levilactobacillus enshiensis]